MIKKNKTKSNKQLRHTRIRKKAQGTAEKPRLLVKRSLKNLEAQMIDDLDGKTLIGVSTKSKEIRSKLKHTGNIEAATELGELMATVASKQGIANVVFDRGGSLYHGRIKAFAEAARKAGLKF